MRSLTIFGSSIIVATLVSSCATTGGAGAPKTQAFAFQGCGAGAVAGGLIGLLSGGDNTLKGAALGCGVGAIIGYSIAKRTEKYIDANRAMDAEISRNQKNTKDLKSYNARLSQGIRSYQQQIQAIKQAKLNASQKQVRLSKLRSTTSTELTKAKTALNSVNNELVVAEKQYKTYTAQAAVAQTKAKPKVVIVRKASNNNQKWKSEIANLKKEKQVLSKHVKSLSALSASI